MTNWQGALQYGDTGQRMIHVIGGREQVGVRFHPATQNGVQFKTYEILFLEFSI